MVKPTASSSPSSTSNGKMHSPRTLRIRIQSRRCGTAPVKASFEVKGIPEKAQAELIGGDRKTEVNGGKFEESFQGYEVKLYKIR
jgi:hypothetical protein